MNEFEELEIEDEVMSNTGLKKYEKLLEEWNHYQDPRPVRRNIELETLFELDICPTLNDFLSFSDLDMEIERTEKDITVYVRSEDNILLSCLNDDRLLKVLYFATTSEVFSENEKIVLKIWFNLEERVTPK